jgi:CIC family chloride channel protein
LSDEKQLRSWNVLRERRRHQYWRAALVGLGAGCIALLFQESLHLAEDLRHSLLTYLHQDHARWGWIVLPLIAASAGMLAGWLTSRFSPEAAGSGIPHVQGVLMHVNTLNWRRVLPVKFIGGVLCIGAGFSLGREGPTVQMGAAVGKLVADVLQVPAKAAPRLMACGSGAGLAAAFHAPLAGFIFTVEELQREFSSLTYTMALIAAVAADIVTTSVMGTGNAFHATGFPAASLAALPACIAAGALAGLCGAGFNKSLLYLRQQSQKHITAPAWARAGVAGLIVGLALWWFPDLGGGGHGIAERMVHGDIEGLTATNFLLMLFVGKFALTLVCYLAGVPGGIFAPMLVMGASLGLLSGALASFVLPAMVPIPQSLAAIGMAAFFTAVVRAPLTGVVLVLEMTGDWQQLLPLLTASMVAYALSERLGVVPIYEALLSADMAQRQPDVPAHREPVLLEFLVQEESKMDGRKIKELPLPERCLFVTITRHGESHLPDGDFVLHRGDHITAVISGKEASASVVRVLSMSKAD